ncbi:MAG TPA: YcxB family protein, partial [Dokdonella sp.]
RRFQLPRRARRLFAQQKNLQRPVTFSWDEDGLAWASVNGSGRTPWADYLKWRQNERLYLLYHSDLMFQMLPKRAFASAAQQQSFARHLDGIAAA